jgi:hypothetical protein
LLLQIEILQECPVDDPEMRVGLRDLKASTHKAANLTRQLLLFSRKQAPDESRSS